MVKFGEISWEGDSRDTGLSMNNDKGNLASYLYIIVLKAIMYHSHPIP